MCPSCIGVLISAALPRESNERTYRILPRKHATCSGDEEANSRTRCTYSSRCYSCYEKMLPELVGASRKPILFSLLLVLLLLLWLTSFMYQLRLRRLRFSRYTAAVLLASTRSTCRSSPHARSINYSNVLHTCGIDSYSSREMPLTAHAPESCNKRWLTVSRGTSIHCALSSILPNTRSS